MQLTPLFILRCETAAGSSDVAMRLRDGGYIVTKVFDDETALTLAAAPHVDGVIVDLPVLAAIAFVRRIEGDVPSLVVTHSPDAVSRACGAATVSRRTLDELVPAADRMLIDRELRATGS